MIVSAVYINFFCLDANLLVTSGSQPGFFELEQCPISLNIISTALLSYNVLLFLIGGFQLISAITRLKDNNDDSRQLMTAAKILIIFSCVFLFYLYSSSVSAWLQTL